MVGPFAKRFAFAVGDIVAQVGRSRRMIVVDIDLDPVLRSPSYICAWQPAPIRHPLERGFPASMLILLARSRVK